MQEYEIRYPSDNIAHPWSRHFRNELMVTPQIFLSVNFLKQISNILLVLILAFLLQTGSIFLCQLFCPNFFPTNASLFRHTPEKLLVLQIFFLKLYHTALISQLNFTVLTFSFLARTHSSLELNSALDFTWTGLYLLVQIFWANLSWFRFLFFAFSLAKKWLNKTRRGPLPSFACQCQLLEPTSNASLYFITIWWWSIQWQYDDPSYGRYNGPSSGNIMIHHENNSSPGSFACQCQCQCQQRSDSSFVAHNTRLITSNQHLFS